MTREAERKQKILVQFVQQCKIMCHCHCEEGHESLNCKIVEVMPQEQWYKTSKTILNAQDEESIASLATMTLASKLADVLGAKEIEQLKEPGPDKCHAKRRWAR